MCSLLDFAQIDDVSYVVMVSLGNCNCPFASWLAHFSLAIRSLLIRSRASLILFKTY